MKLICALVLVTSPLAAQARVVVTPHWLNLGVTSKATASCKVYRHNGTVVPNAACTWTVRNTTIGSATTPAIATTITTKLLGATHVIARYGTRRPDSVRVTVVKVASVGMGFSCPTSDTLICKCKHISPDVLDCAIQ